MFSLTCNNCTVRGLGLKTHGHHHNQSSVAAVGQKVSTFILHNRISSGLLNEGSLGFSSDISCLLIPNASFGSFESKFLLDKGRRGIPLSFIIHPWRITRSVAGTEPSLRYPSHWSSNTAETTRRRKQNRDIFIPSWFSVFLPVCCFFWHSLKTTFSFLFTLNPNPL